jgi:ubiquinone biosynthesis protein COQ9
MNWYSKRLLLAAVYKSTEIYMLQDQSPDKIETLNFLERRLNDFQTLGSVRNTVKKSIVFFVGYIKLISNLDVKISIGYCSNS